MILVKYLVSVLILAATARGQDVTVTVSVGGKTNTATFTGGNIPGPVRTTNCNAGVVAMELDGDGGIKGVYPTSWRGTNNAARLRLSRDEPDSRGAQHFLVYPYEYGMAIEYNPGVIEVVSSDFSLHHAYYGQGSRFWVGDGWDYGGLRLTAQRQGGVYGEIATQTFPGESGGDMRFRLVSATNSFSWRWGTDGKNSELYRLAPDGFHFGSNVVSFVGTNLCINGRIIRLNQ